MRALPAVRVTPEWVPFAGGLDTVTPPLELSPGFARDAQNFEQDINGGYTRITGYERYDGHARPSDAIYSILPCSAVGTNATDGSVTITGGTSGATGVVIGSGTGYLVLTKTTGTFQAESCSPGSVVATGAQVISGASSSLLNAQYLNSAASVYRALISAVPGSGNILGVWVYNDVVYAFRNNAGGTAIDMYQATGSGWSKIALGRELKYTTGTATIAEGTTITGATSGATGVLKRLTLESGTYGGSNAVGRFIFATVTGTFQNAENLQVAGVTKAVANGADTAITFTNPNGRFEFVNANFGGSVNTLRMYGCDGVNRGFEFDGTVFVPIATGMTTDTPTHVVAHKNYLFFSFVGSIQFSQAGNPYVWSPIVGAGEIAMGDSVTGFMSQPGGAADGALTIFTKTNISTLYGATSAAFNLVPFNQNAGGVAYTIQRIGNTLMLDARGLTNLTTTQAYGNFAWATLSRRIQTWLNTRRPLATASCVARDKTQYRLFFSSGAALFCTLDNGAALQQARAPVATGDVVGLMPILFPNPVRCACSAQLSDGSEAIYFGSTNGMVYQMEKGTSFDGAAIEAYLTLAFNPSESQRTLKRYRHATFEVSGKGYAEFNATYQLGYNTTDIDQPGSTTQVAALSPSFWDAVSWDAFIWDGAALLPTEFDMVGSGENVSIMLRSNAAYFAPLQISGVTLHHTPRRLLR